MKLSLVIMAAGLGSRYKGGLKQLERIGPNGETLMEYSIDAAKKVGFNEVIFIIRKDIEEEFKELMGNKINEKIAVRYVFQQLDNLPLTFQNQERTKPWGTGHAIWSLGKIENNFVVINADDYYGIEAFQNMYDFLSQEEVNSYHYCMSGYILKNTLSENGAVTRGVCTTENEYLKNIVETHQIDKNSNIDMDSIVSLNLWGFTPTIMEELNQKFIRFLEQNTEDSTKEFLLPSVIDDLLKEKKIDVKVLKTNDKWYGLTFIEDKEYVKTALAKEHI